MNKYEQLPISKEKFLLIRKEDVSHRKIFSQNSGIQINKQKGSVSSFSVSFEETIRPIYEVMTGSKLIFSTKYHNYWHPLRNEDEIKKVESWVKSQGNRVFLKDSLFASIALSVYDSSEEKKGLSLYFYTLKYCQWNDNLFGLVVNEFVRTIQELPFYNQCKYICAVPPRPGKQKRDLPTEISKEVAKKLSIEDITEYFKYDGEKEQGKNLSRDEKWNAWENARLSCTKNLENKDVILIDDLYQSGISVNFVGMALQKAGCGKICGLYIVKSLRDTDNT